MFLMGIIIQCIKKMKETKTELGKALAVVAIIVLSMVVWCIAEYSIIAWVSILCFYFHKFPGWKRISFVIANLILCLFIFKYSKSSSIHSVFRAVNSAKVFSLELSLELSTLLLESLILSWESLHPTKEKQVITAKIPPSNNAPILLYFLSDF